MSAWEKMARSVWESCGVQIDWDERFFICPDCGEPIYEADWDDEDLCLDGNFICPICESTEL